MNKTWLIIEREYLTRVKKKSFLLTTLLIPVVIVAFYAIIIAISMSGETKESKVAVIDRAGLFDKEANPSNPKMNYSFVNEDEETFKHLYKTNGYNLFIFIPEGFDKDGSQIKVYSQSSLKLLTKSEIERNLGKALEQRRLAAASIDPNIYKKIKADVSIQNIVDTGKGEQKGSAGIAYILSLVAGVLIYMILIIYGTMVMRGIMEEKTNRIAEVIVSSVKPFQLMMGKIVGIGAVGLTQFAIWIVVMLVLQMLVPLFVPNMMQQVGDPAATAAIAENAPTATFNKVMESINTLPLGLIAFCFIFYFFGGYMLYAALFGAVGSIVSEDQQDSQQFVFPVMMPLIVGFVIMMKAVNDPDSSLAVFGSIFPLTSPIVMLARITYGVPWWQLVISMLILIATFVFFIWVAAKIYRTGILMYGKKVTWKELMKWMFTKG